jgi:hypothetical protein
MLDDLRSGLKIEGLPAHCLVTKLPVCFLAFSENGIKSDSESG